MKKIIFISMAATFFYLKGIGQKIKESEVPAAVKTSFAKLLSGYLCQVGKGRWKL